MRILLGTRIAIVSVLLLPFSLSIGESQERAPEPLQFSASAVGELERHWDVTAKRVLSGEKLSDKTIKQCRNQFRDYVEWLYEKNNKAKSFTEYADEDRAAHYVNSIKIAVIDPKRHGGRPHLHAGKRLSYNTIKKRLENEGDAVLMAAIIIPAIEFGKTQFAIEVYRELYSKDPDWAKYIWVAVERFSSRNTAAIAFLIEDSTPHARAADQPEEERRVIPPHPTRIAAYHRSEEYPVVAVLGKRPVMEEDGTRRKVPPRFRFRLLKAPNFSGGRIMIVDERQKHKIREIGELGGMAYRPSSIPGQGLVQLETRRMYYQVTGEFRADLVPDRTLRNCYAVLVTFERDFLLEYERKPLCGFSFKEIGAVAADDETHISIRIPVLETRKPTSFFIMLFSNGQEIKTSDTPLASLFFDRLDRWEHRNAVERHLKENPGANRMALKFRVYPPLIGMPPDAFKAGLQVIAKVAIDRSGLVDEVYIKGGFDDATISTIEGSIREWLFLPKLRDGRPIECVVRFPVEVGVE